LVLPFWGARVTDVPADELAIRHADPARGAAGCAAIYAPYVDSSPVSFEEEPPSASEMAARIEQSSRTHPWLIAERDGQLVAFAYGSQHRTRAAYRWACDVTVYVDGTHHRAGIGRRLYEPLLELLRRQRLQVACAGITLPNDASVALHEALGVQPIGISGDWLQGRRMARCRLVAAAAPASAALTLRAADAAPARDAAMSEDRAARRRGRSASSTPCRSSSLTEPFPFRRPQKPSAIDTTVLVPLMLR
jgi:L-amino acid N-acyltransferase YncA